MQYQDIDYKLKIVQDNLELFIVTQNKSLSRMDSVFNLIEVLIFLSKKILMNWLIISNVYFRGVEIR
jgi:hypothetical protein